MVGLLAEQKQCSSPRLVTLNTMTLVGEHGMQFVADVHFLEAPDVIFVPGGSGSSTELYLPRSTARIFMLSSQCGKVI